MQTSNKTISLSSLVASPENPRLITTGEHLIESILAEGLNTRLLCEAEGEKFIIRQGNSRFNALKSIEKGMPARFAELFPRGVPCTVAVFDTPEERALAICDHGLVRPLNTVAELILSTRVLMRAKPSLSRNELISRLANSLDLVFPIRQPDTLKKLALAKEKGPIEYAKELGNVRAGVAQLLIAGATGPAIIEEYFLAIAREEIPKIALTREQIGNLAKAQGEDYSLKDATGICPFSRTQYGPNVTACINGIIERNAVKDGKAVERKAEPKPISKADLEALSKIAESKILKLILAICSGLLPMDRLAGIDQDLKAKE